MTVIFITRKREKINTSIHLADDHHNDDDEMRIESTYVLMDTIITDHIPVNVNEAYGTIIPLDINQTYGTTTHLDTNQAYGTTIPLDTNQAYGTTTHLDTNQAYVIVNTEDHIYDSPNEEENKPHQEDYDDMVKYLCSF